jgi:hypothetical protein
MTSAAHCVDFSLASATGECGKDGSKAEKPSLLRRLYDTLAEWDVRRSDRAMAGFLSRSGGRFTDAMEREAFQRQFGSNWF